MKLEGEKKAIHDLEQAIRARLPLIAIESPEEGRVLAAIRNLADSPTLDLTGEVSVQNRKLFKWTHTQGIVRLGTLPACKCGGRTVATVNTDKDSPNQGRREYVCTACGNAELTEFPDNTEDPSFAVQDFASYALADNTAVGFLDHASILVLCDIHKFLAPAAEGGEGKSARTVRALRDLAEVLPPTKSTVILLSPHLGNLGDAGRHVHRVNWPLPTIPELIEMVRGIGHTLTERGKVPVDLNGGAEDLGAALAGLTQDEAERVLKLSIVEEKQLSGAMAPGMMTRKAQVLERSTGIKLRIPRFTLEDVGGLELLKEELRRLPLYLKQDAKAAHVRAPRGFLVGGPPGTGKSLAAEATAAAANIPLLQWDLGTTKSKWHGESEARTHEVLKAADAVGRCVLWIDEGEKQMGGGGDGESHDVTESIMAAILTWMQDRVSDVIVFMTVNHPDKLRAELVNRFDSLWFVDFPNQGAAEAIVRIHTTRRGVILGYEDIKAAAAEAVTNELNGREIEQGIEKAMRDTFFDGATMTGDDLIKTLRRARGLASQPKRKAAIEDMRRECAGQFMPASHGAPAAAIIGAPEKTDGFHLDI